jgi:hypothetical protein
VHVRIVAGWSRIHVNLRRSHRLAGSPEQWPTKGERERAVASQPANAKVLASNRHDAAAGVSRLLRIGFLLNEL